MYAELLKRADEVLIQWSEPRPGKTGEGTEIRVAVRIRATVADCISMERMARFSSNDEQLLGDFVALHFAEVLDPAVQHSDPTAKGKPFKRPEGLFWLYTDNGDGERWHLCTIKMVPQGNVTKRMLCYVTEDFEDYWYDEDWCPEEIVEISPPLSPPK